MRAENFKAARDMFARALALNPRDVPALAACAHCEGLAGQTNAARNLYARALQVTLQLAAISCCLLRELPQEAKSDSFGNTLWSAGMLDFCGPGWKYASNEHAWGTLLIGFWV